jgi:hypothetical protein
MPSSVIRDFDYRQPDRELRILFVTGRRYVYRDVPPEVVEAFELALSKGRFFNARIRDHYDADEIGPAPKRRIS